MDAECLIPCGTFVNPDTSGLAREDRNNIFGEIGGDGEGLGVIANQNQPQNVINQIELIVEESFAL